MHKRIQRNNSGFTIIEVLAVIVIFAILTILFYSQLLLLV